jgi:hypothetical protein
LSLYGNSEERALNIADLLYDSRIDGLWAEPYHQSAIALAFR